MSVVPGHYRQLVRGGVTRIVRGPPSKWCSPIVWEVLSRTATWAPTVSCPGYTAGSASVVDSHSIRFPGKNLGLVRSNPVGYWYLVLTSSWNRFTPGKGIPLPDKITSSTENFTNVYLLQLEYVKCINKLMISCLNGKI